MLRKANIIKQIEKALIQAYQMPHRCSVSPLWHHKVMSALQGESLVHKELPVHNSIWPTAWWMAAAALAILWLGLQWLPSNADLAWQLHRDGIVSAWELYTGGRP